MTNFKMRRKQTSGTSIAAFVEYRFFKKGNQWDVRMYHCVLTELKPNEQINTENLNWLLLETSTIENKHIILIINDLEKIGFSIIK